MLFSSSNQAQYDLLEKGFQKVESASIAGVPSLEKTTGACSSRAGLHARPLALGTCGRVGHPKNLEKILENRENYFTEVRAISF